jgi:hypothetical protein
VHDEPGLPLHGVGSGRSDHWWSATFATSWLTHTAQIKSARLAAERARREELYGRFAEELALLYSFVLGEEGLSYTKLMTIMGLRGRIIRNRCELPTSRRTLNC